MIHVYTGDGKGKTTAAIGLALRALGRGKKVAVIQFMKGRLSGEILALSFKKPFKDQIEIRMFGGKNLVDFQNITHDDRLNAKAAIESFAEIAKKNYKLIILDEINVAIAFGLLGLEEALKVIKKVDSKVDLVLTGRRAHLKIIEMADLVTEMKNVKHPFDQGTKAKKGIEY